jgi:GNAT superfamily N-acetyltransferase
MIQVKPVASKKELAAFVDYPYDLYKDDKNYVPELHIAQRDLLSPGKHPFHVVAGRIAAIINGNHNAFKKVNEGFFGFFDVPDNAETAAALFNAAETWLKNNGATTIKGPVNPSTNEPCGLLVEGFNSPPVAMMTYNKPYYAGLITANGYQKSVDLLAYKLTSEGVDQRTIDLKELLLKRLQSRGISIRTINMKDFANEVSKVLQVYNAAWQENTGFVPMTENEFRYLAKDLKMVLDKDFCLLAEHNGKVIGFALAIPDINQVLIKIKRGRLFPTGIFKLLFGLKKIDFIRVLALGVTADYRKLGIEACFYAEIIQQAFKKGIKGAEASWILEHNEMMNNGLIKLNGEMYKRYRIFEKAL